MANEDRLKLFKAINKAGYDIGSYDDFDKRMNNADDRQKFYTAVNEAGYDIGSQEDFERRISPSKYSIKVGDRDIPVSEREYKDFLKRHPNGSSRPAPKPRQAPSGGAAFGLPEGTAYSDEVERRHDSPSNVAGSYKDRAQIASEVQSVGLPAYGQGSKRPVQRDASSYGIPYRPDIELTAAQRDEIAQQNGYAAKQVKQMRQQREKERRRRSQPVVDTGNENVNRHVIKTQGQWEDEVTQGASRISHAVVAPAVKKAIEDFDKKAHEVFEGTREGANNGGLPTGTASGATIFGSIKESNKAKDPEKVLDYLKGQMEALYKDQSFIDKVGEEADKMGIDRNEYLEKVVKPQIEADLGRQFDNAMIDKYLPKSGKEYVVSGLSNSIIGMLADAFLETKGQRSYKNEAAAMTEEGLNPHYTPGTGAKLAQMGVSFAADAPFFGFYGKVGGNVAKGLAERQIRKLTAKGLSEGAARSIVGTALENSVGQRMKNYIMQHVVSSSITMGGYNATSETARQVRDREFKPGQIIGSTAEGLATGSAFGLTGGAVQALSQPLSGIAKIGSKVGGYLTEGETMYATEELAKMVHGEEGFTNPFEGSAEAMMKLGVMKASGGHLLGKAGEKLMRAREVGVKQAAAETAAGILGRQQTGVRFTPEEEAYVRDSAEGKSLLDALSQMHPEVATTEVKGKRRLTAEGEKMRQELAERYDAFMGNTEIPYAVKAKVAGALGGLMPDAAHTPLETGADIIHNADGSVILKTRDKDGNCMQELKFDSFSEADRWREEHEGDFRLNDAVNMWNGASPEARANTIKQLMEEYGIGEEEAATMIKSALGGNMGKDFSNDQLLYVYNTVRDNAYPADEPNTRRNYWEGQKLTPQERHQAMVEAQQAEDRLTYMDQAFADEIIGAADFPDEKIAELAGRDEITGEQLQAAIDYYNKAARFNGMMEKAAQSVDDQVEAANAFIRRNTHTDSGNVVEVELGGRGYYLTAGKIELNPDGTLNMQGCGDVMILRDKETGEIQVASPRQIKVTALSDPQRMIAENESMEGLRGQLMKEANNSIILADGTPEAPQEAGELFTGADGRTYMVNAEVDEAGNVIWSKVEVTVDENGEPMEMVGEPQPLDIEEYRKAKSDEIDAANRPEEEIQQPETPLATEAVTDGESQGIDVQPHTEDVSDEGGAGNTDAPAPPLRIPVDEKGRQQFELARPEDTVAELTERYGEEKARKMIATMAENTARAYEELSQKDTSKMTDMAELAAHEDALAEAARKRDYWAQFTKAGEPLGEVVPEEKPAAEQPQSVPELTDNVPKLTESVPETPESVPSEQQPVIPQEPTPPAEKPAEPQPPVQPQQPTAEQKIAEGSVKANLGKTFEFRHSDGRRTEMRLESISPGGRAVVTQTDYDAQGNRIGEPQRKVYNVTDIGGSIIQGAMKPVLSTEEKLRAAYKGRVGILNVIDVLTDSEQEQMLRAYENGDNEALTALMHEFTETHREDIILNERDKRNANVSQIMEGSGSREDKLRRVRKQYQGYDDAVLALSDEAMQPTTLEEYVADLHSRVPKSGEGPIAYFSYDRDGTKVVGMQDETGHGSKTGGDTKGYAPWLAPKGKGMSLQQYAESLHSQLPDGIRDQYSDQDVRNAILEVFGGAERPSDITTMVIKRGIIQAEQAARRMEEMWIEGGPSFHRVSIDDNTFAGRLARGKQQTNTEPTEKQKEAGNYKKGHVSFGGYDFVIENPEGSMRRGKDADGNTWEQQMHNTYGYILGKKGKDGDHLDMFINDQADLDTWNGNVYVVDQVNADGSFDESKILYGFDSEAEAREAYLSNYKEGWQGLGRITGVDKDTFDKWLDSSTRQMKPFAEHSIIKDAVKSVETEPQAKAPTPAERDKVLMDAVVDKMREAGIDVSTDWEEGQRVIDEYNGSHELKPMGQKTNKKKARIAADLEGKELTPEQQAVVDVYTGKKNNATVTFTHDGNDRTVLMRQGDEKGAGTKHSLYRHYGTGVGVITADDIMRIPDVLANGELTGKKRGKTRLNVYQLTDEDGTKYTVLTEISNRGKEVFNDFYTNRKASSAARLTADNSAARLIDKANGHTNTQLSAQADTDNASKTSELEQGTSNTAEQQAQPIQSVSGAKVQQNPETTKESDEKLKQQKANVVDMFAKNVDMSKPVEETIPQNPDIWEALNIKDRVEAMSPQELIENYRRINSQMLEEDGMTVDEHTEKVRTEHIEKNGVKGLGQVMADDLRYLSDKYGFGKLSLRWDLLDRIKELGLEEYANSDKPYDPGEMPAVPEKGKARVFDMHGRPMFFKTSDGHAYGFTYRGKIYLDPRIATAETPIHEYGHLWAEMKRQTAPEEWDAIKNVLLNDKLVKPIIDRVKKDYPELAKEGREDDFIEEILTQFSGKRGAERLREISEEITAERGGVFGKAEAVTAMQRLKSVLAKFWAGVAKMMGWKYRNANEIADRMMSDLLEGVNPRERMKEASVEDIKPVGTGDFGDIYDQFKGKPKEAVEFLLKKKGGEAVGALSHKDVGDIDLVWGEEGTGKSDGFGLAKLAKYHPEVLDNLQEILDDMHVVQRTENRVNLESNTHKAAVRLTWNKEKKNWLLTAFEKKNSALDNTTDTGKTSDRGKRNDTATPQSTVSEGKDTKNNDTLQENWEENAEKLLREGNGALTVPLKEKVRSAKDLREREAFAERQWRRAHERAEESIKKLNLTDGVTVVDSIDELPGAEKLSGRQRRAKGWYDPDTGKIVIVMGNHRSPEDVVRTILHEGVAHHGLRKLFGENFDQFLDNVYGSAESRIKEDIDALAAKKYAGDARKSTEEYLAQLAEDTEFEGAENKPWVKHWFNQVKSAFLNMLKQLGLPGFKEELTDNELRYILWRSYKNLSEPGRYRNVFQRAADATMKKSLGVADGARVIRMGHIEDEIPLTVMSKKDEEAIRARVKQMGLGEAKAAYERINAQMLDEDGLDIDEHSDKVRKDWIREHGREGLGKAMSDDLQALMDKYGSGKVELRWELQDRINELGAAEPLMRDGEETVNDEAPKFQRVSNPEPELTPEEKQYWKQWDAAMRKWKERNAIAAEATGPSEKPALQRGESAVDYAKKLIQWRRENATWQTAPKLEDFHQVRDDKAAQDEAHANEKAYPDSESAKRWRVATDLARLRHAMSRQKAYDKATVKAVTDFAQDFMKMGFGDNLGRGEMERLLSSVKNATGAKDIRKQVDNIMNILIDNQLRNLDQQVVKLSSVKELSKTAQGVEKQGRLELKGQRMIQAFRQAREGRMDAEKIRERLGEVAEKMARNDDEAPMWEQEYEGLSIALQYQENIEGSRDEWADLDHEYKDAVKEYKQSGRSYKAQQELLESLEQAMMENKIERIGMFGDIIGRLQGNISESMQGAREFVEREKERVKHIQQIANFDLAGKDMGAMREKIKGKPANFFLQPLATFEQMLKQFGSRNANGEGYLYDHFMRSWMDSTDKAYVNEQKAKEELDAKAREVFGDKVKRWSDLYDIVRKLPTLEVEVLDGEDPKTFTLNQGNLLYIYMADKMTDGRMKLRKMGIDEETVEKVKDFLDPRLVQLGDWLQDEYLVQKRTEYNKVHERMFGAPMAAIDHYFPLKILGDARYQEQDVSNMADQDAVLPSTITGNIIKRRKNALPLDILHTDALSLAIEHVEDMERWAATAEWNKDINTLLSYTTFRNKVKNMSTIYGSGDALWNTFADTARMAAGTYRPKAKPGSVDTAISNIAKGVTAAKINFRVYTAFKQLLSAPAFLHDVNIGDFVKDSVNPYGSWKWAMENMPVFRKRWKSRQVGDTRLMDDPTDWKMWKTNLVQMATRMGMSPNALVDGVTCAVGARSIYESRYRKYKKIGASDEVARKRALQDAEIGYNLTQQSSEGAFVSAIQKDRTVAANMLSVFRNSSMAYTRQWVDAARNLKHRTQKGYKEDAIGFMTRQLQEQFGIDEAHAKKVAEAEYARSGRRDVARMLNMMFGVTVAWNLGASLPYLFTGDDEDLIEFNGLDPRDWKIADWDKWKNSTKAEMLTDALLRGLAAGPTEGFAAGNLFSEFISRSFASEQTRKAFRNEGWGSAIDSALKQGGDYEVNPLPLMADIQGMIKKMGYDKFAAAQDVFNICAQSAVGVNPQTFTDMWNACMDYGAPGWDGTSYSWDKDNLARPKEIALFIMRLMNAPTSSWRNKYIDELGMNAEDAQKLSYEEMASRYAHYKHWKDAPIMGWLRGEEGRQEKMEKIRKQFDKAVEERMGRIDYEHLREMLDDTEDDAEKKLILKSMKGQTKALDNKELLRQQADATSDAERKMLTGVVKERAKEGVGMLSDEALADSIDGTGSLDRKNDFIGEYAKRQGTQDYYGRADANDTYKELRTYKDVNEDILLSDLARKMKTSGDERARKKFNSLKAKVSRQRLRLGSSDSDADAEMMGDIRSWRREAIETAMRAESGR